MPSVNEPLRIGTLDDLSPASLGFKPGVTTTEEARATLEARGLTGIAASAYADEAEAHSADAVRIEAFGADYQSRVHLFENGKYRESIELPTGKVIPYGEALSIAEGRDGTVLLVLYRDPLAQRGAPPMLLSYVVGSKNVALASSAALRALVQRHHGMTSPALIGSDLDAGVMLVARDRHGDLWDQSYLVRIDRGQVSLKPKSMLDALRCSCVRTYAYGSARR